MVHSLRFADIPSRCSPPTRRHRAWRPHLVDGAAAAIPVAHGAAAGGCHGGAGAAPRPGVAQLVSCRRRQRRLGRQLRHAHGGEGAHDSAIACAKSVSSNMIPFPCLLLFSSIYRSNQPIYRQNRSVYRSKSGFVLVEFEIQI
jgi:hypothetical protein